MIDPLKNKIIYFCGGRRCCPSIQFEEDKVVLKDDFGGEVKYTIEELENLRKVLNERVAVSYDFSSNG